MNDITIHTDGSCETQTRVGGWAVIQALSALKKDGCTVTVYTDSNYVVKGVNEWLVDWIARGWLTASKQPVANRNLWEQLQALLDKHAVTLTWIPCEQNTQADRLAQEARLNHSVTNPVKLTTHLMIAGSRDATPQMLDYARRAVRRAHERGYTVIVGDNPKGVDMAVVRECRRLKTPVIVAGVGNVPRNGGCKHGQYIKIHSDTYRGASGYLLNRYTVRDRWLVDNAQIGVFVWNGDSPGTKAGYDYMVSRGKEAHLINFGMEV